MCIRDSFITECIAFLELELETKIALGDSKTMAVLIRSCHPSLCHLLFLQNSNSPSTLWVSAILLSIKPRQRKKLFNITFLLVTQFPKWQVHNHRCSHVKSNKLL